MSETNNPFTSLLAAQSAAQQPQTEEVTPAPDSIFMSSAEMQTDELTLEELANYDSDNIRALADRAESIIAARENAMLENPESLRSVLDALDAAISSDYRYDIFSLATVRGYVKSIMITLAKYDEFMTVLLDSDVRNIIAYAKASYESARLVDEVKVAKAKTPTAQARTAKSDAQKRAADAVSAMIASGFQLKL